MTASTTRHPAAPTGGIAGKGKKDMPREAQL